MLVNFMETFNESKTEISLYKKIVMFKTPHILAEELSTYFKSLNIALARYDLITFASLSFRTICKEPISNSTYSWQLLVEMFNKMC